ncbi:MAG: tetratricopeptide repeat protein, partial [Ginsengibacter sp.]
MKISKATIFFLWTVVIPGIAFAVISSDIEAYFEGEPLRIAFVFILTLLLAFLSWDKYSNLIRKELISQYELFKGTHELEPEDLGFQQIEPSETIKPGLRPYYDIYIPRTAIPFERRDDTMSSINPSQIYTEEQLGAFLENSSGLLLIGGPTEGKTRTLFEIMRKLPGFLVIKIQQGAEPEKAAIELLRGKKVVWLVDDLHTLAESGSSPSGYSFAFNSLLSRISNVTCHCALVGTSRNAGELDKFDLTSKPVREFYGLFKLKLVLARPDDEDFEKLKEAIGNTDPRRFPTIGSIPMHEHFEEMRARFRRMGQLEKNCVLSLILLNEAGIYEMTQPRIQALLRDIFRHGQSIDGATLLSAIDRLTKDGFIISLTVSGVIIPEEAYITGEEAAYYYPTGTSPENRKKADDMAHLGACLLKNEDAEGMNQLAISYYYANQKEAALNLWDQISIHFRESLEPQKNVVARALINKGVVLVQFGKPEQAIACYALVEARYQDSPEPALREQVARALVNKEVTLGQLGKSEEAIACCELVEARYQDALEPALREQVARALVNKGVTLGQLGKSEQAIACFDLVEARYQDSPETALREPVARALINKGVVLVQFGKPEQAI